MDCLLQHRFRAPRHAPEYFGGKAVSCKANEGIAAIHGRTDDRINALEGGKSVIDDIQGEVRQIAAYEDGTTKTRGKGLTKAMLHPFPEVRPLLREVLIQIPESLSHIRRGIRRIKTNLEGEIPFF